jgi:hypothetical protein
MLNHDFLEELHLNFAIAKFIGDERQQTRRGTCVPQVAVNAAASVKLVIPEGGKYEKSTLF